MSSMYDITKGLGLPAKLDLDTGEIEFGVPVEKTVFRPLNELIQSGVLYNSSQIPIKYLNKLVTIIYRFINDSKVRKVQGIEADSDQGVKFDVTVLMSYRGLDENWTWEYPKTFGHYHREIPGFSIASPDFYQIVHGKGLLLLQQVVQREVVSYVIGLEQGQTVLIPPYLAHMTINTGQEPLVFANVCVRSPHLNYDDILRFGGGHTISSENVTVVFTRFIIASI